MPNTNEFAGMYERRGDGELIVYLDANFEPTPKEHAVAAKIISANGDSSFVTFSPAEEQGDTSGGEGRKP